MLTVSCRGTHGVRNTRCVRRRLRRQNAHLRRQQHIPVVVDKWHDERCRRWSHTRRQSAFDNGFPVPGGAMKLFGLWEVLALAVLASATCAVSNDASPTDSSLNTTSSVIAIANLDQQIAQLREEPGVEELLLVRSRFLGDYEALDRASSLGEGRFATSRELLLRARTRSAVHRFAGALEDIHAAVCGGARLDEVVALRASILVATGRAAETTLLLEERLARHPGYASRAALAGGYAALGRLADADRLYVEALADLDTTLPFPY